MGSARARRTRRSWPRPFPFAGHKRLGAAACRCRQRNKTCLLILHLAPRRCIGSLRPLDLAFALASPPPAPSQGLTLPCPALPCQRLAFCLPFRRHGFLQPPFRANDAARVPAAAPTSAPGRSGARATRTNGSHIFLVCMHGCAGAGAAAGAAAVVHAAVPSTARHRAHERHKQGPLAQVLHTPQPTRPNAHAQRVSGGGVSNRRPQRQMCRGRARGSAHAAARPSRTQAPRMCRLGWPPTGACGHLTIYLTTTAYEYSYSVKSST